MNERPGHGAGRFAVYQGNVYRAFGYSSSPEISLAREEGDPIPEGLKTDPNAAGRVFITTPDHLEAWYSVRWTFNWRGEPFDAIGSGNGSIGGHYTGSRRWLVSEALEQEEAGVWRGLFPLSEVTNLTEHREDLLAQWREEQARFAAANWYRNGTFAAYRGFTYGAYPNLAEDGRVRLLRQNDDEPLPGGTDPGTRHKFGQEYLVDPGEVEQWFSSKWTYTVQGLLGAPFEAVGMHKGEIVGIYTGADEELARKYLKLTPETDPPEYYRAFLVTAVDDLTEHREDLLARWKEEHPS